MSSFPRPQKSKEVRRCTSASSVLHPNAHRLDVQTLPTASARRAFKICWVHGRWGSHNLRTNKCAPVPRPFLLRQVQSLHQYCSNMAKKLLSLTVYCSSIDGCITWVNTTHITNQYSKWCYSSMNKSGKSVKLNGWNTQPYGNTISAHFPQTTTETSGFLPSTSGPPRLFFKWLDIAGCQSRSLCLTAMNHYQPFDQPSTIHHQPISSNII